MNWDAISAVAEVVGVIAVVVSLVYLAIQIREQNKESRLAAMHEISEAFRDSISTFSSAEMAGVAARGNEDFDALSDTEVMQLIAGYQRIFRVWEEAFHQYKAGRLDRNIWDVMVLQYSSFLSSPSLGRVWDLRRQYYNGDFQDFVETLDTVEYKIR